MQGKPGFDHYDSGDAGAPEDCGDCRFYRPDWKYLLFYLAQRCIPHEIACHWRCAPFSKAKKRRSLISKTPALEHYMIGSWL